MADNNRQSKVWTQNVTCASKMFGDAPQHEEAFTETRRELKECTVFPWDTAKANVSNF